MVDRETVFHVKHPIRLLGGRPLVDRKTSVSRETPISALWETNRCLWIGKVSVSRETRYFQLPGKPTIAWPMGNGVSRETPCYHNRN